MGNYKQLDSIPILKQTVNNVDAFYFTDEEKANCSNNHFTSVSQLDDSKSHLPQFALKTHSELSNIEIQQSLIEDISSSLDLNKAVGPDLISHRVMKATQLTISKPLCNLFNKSLHEGVFPCQLKNATLI